MRRGLFVALTLVTLTTLGSAQQPIRNQVPPVARNGPPDTRERADALAALMKSNLALDRMMSFDRNHDGRLAKEELPERMQPLVSESDFDGDGTLDGTEIRNASRRPAPTTTGGAPHASGYAFGDQVGVSSRVHVVGAIDDLRLPDDTLEHALAVAREFLDRHEADAIATLTDRLEGVLSAEQLAALTDALERHAETPVVAFLPADQPVLRFLFGAASGGPPFELRGLSKEQGSKTVHAFASYKGFRLTDADRSELLDQMNGILTDEERDNLRAALERRPLVKAGIVGGIVQGITVADAFDARGGRNMMRPAVLVTPVTPSTDHIR